MTRGQKGTGQARESKDGLTAAVVVLAGRVPVAQVSLVLVAVVITYALTQSFSSVRDQGTERLLIVMVSVMWTLIILLLAFRFFGGPKRPQPGARGAEARAEETVPTLPTPEPEYRTEIQAAVKTNPVEAKK